MSNNPQGQFALDFADPGKIPESLLSVPGMVNDLTEFTLSQAHSPNRTLAFCGALAGVAHLTGNAVCDRHGTYTNLNLICLGESGIGKDAPRRTNSRLAAELGISSTVGEEMASGEALEEALVASPNFLLQADEIDNLAGNMMGHGRLANGMSSRLRRISTSSGGTYRTRGKAGKGAGMVIDHPHLTLFGTGTPDAFYRSLTPESIVNGLYGRCLVLEVPDEYCIQNPEVLPVPQSLIESAKRLVKCGIVDETPEATALLKEASDWCMKMRQETDKKELPLARALTVRMYEKIAKLALIGALSQNPAHPLITGECVKWAASFVVHVTKQMLYTLQFHVSEGRFDALRQRVLGLMVRHGGSIYLSKLLQNIHVDAGLLEKVMLTLEKSNLVNKEVLAYRKIEYTLTDVA